jgi:hypothetical protein
MSSSNSEPITLPTINQIWEILSNYDHRWCLSEYPTYVFDYGLVKTQRLSPICFNIKLRTYEVHEIELSDLLNTETILVYGYILEFEMVYNGDDKQWEIDKSEIKNQELQGENINTLPNPEKILKNLINRVGDDLIEQSEPEDLMNIDLNKVHSSLRKLLSERSS